MSESSASVICTISINAYGCYHPNVEVTWYEYELCWFPEAARMLFVSPLDKITFVCLGETKTI